MSDPPLLIFDLDETLVFASDGPLEVGKGVEAGGYHIYKRPYVDELIDAVKGDYQLAIWTAAGSEYARLVAAMLFSDDAALDFVWSRARCTMRVDEMSGERVWVKDLKKVKRRGYDLERVLMVDDSPEKMTRNYGNHIRVAPFEGDPLDQELALLARYLKKIRHEKNYRSIEKRGWRSEARNA